MALRDVALTSSARGEAAEHQLRRRAVAAAFAVDEAFDCVHQVAEERKRRRLRESRIDAAATTLIVRRGHGMFRFSLGPSPRRPTRT